MSGRTDAALVLRTDPSGLDVRSKGSVVADLKENRIFRGMQGMTIVPEFVTDVSSPAGWQLVRGGRTVATDSSPGGWTVKERDGTSNDYAIFVQSGPDTEPGEHKLTLIRRYHPDPNYEPRLMKYELEFSLFGYGQFGTPNVSVDLLGKKARLAWDEIPQANGYDVVIWETNKASDRSRNVYYETNTSREIPIGKGSYRVEVYPRKDFLIAKSPGWTSFRVD
jgi:hypothetical protein